MLRLRPVLALLLLSGCSILDTKSERGYSEDGSWSASAGKDNNPAGTTFTTADVRVITQRMHPVLKVPVVCVEPSPDVADALSSAAGLTAKGGTTTVNGTLSLTGASSEAVAELAGRSTALLGLRDGLFEACQAYGNGAIGQDTYALITSVYGQLMTTLFLAQDATTPSAQAAANATSPNIPQSAGSSSNDGGGTGKQPKSGNTTSDASYEATTSGQPDVKLAADQAGLPIQLVANPSPTKAKELNGAPTTNDGASTADKQVAAGVGGNALAANPLALVRMNEDFMHGGLLRTLLVACINEYDPSRDREGMGDAVNKFLEGVCNQMNLKSLEALEQVDATVNAEEGFKAVDPTSAAIAAPSGTKSTNAIKKTVASAKKTPRLIVNILHLVPTASADRASGEHDVCPPFEKLRTSAATAPPVLSSI